MNYDHKDVILKTWETQIKLAAAFGESCWKIRAWSYTTATGGLAFAYKTQIHEVALITAGVTVLFFLQDAGYRRLQDQAIGRTHELEIALNDMLAGDKYPRIPDDGVSTRLRTPTATELWMLISLKRWMFWLPYLLIVVACGGYYVWECAIAPYIRSAGK